MLIVKVFSSVFFVNELIVRKFSKGEDDRVVRASASGAVGSGLIPSRVKLMTLKLLFTASQLDTQR